MAKDLNRCEFIGRLGRDPEVRYLQSGTAIANFSIAVGNTWKNKDGEKQESTEWVNIEAWGKPAELFEQYLSKGDRIYVSGPMKTQSWEDNEGVTKYKTSVVVKEFQFLNTKGDSNGDGKSGGKGNGSGKSSGGGRGGQSYPEDDIPF